MSTLFENDYVELSLDPKVPCLEWIGKKPLPSDAFRESETKSLELFEQNRATHGGLQWFVDARKVGAVLPEDTEWVSANILPKMAKAGLKKEAFVVPESALGRMAVRNYKSKAGDTIEIKVFSSPEEAKDWLRS